MAQPDHKGELRRSISLPVLTLYGLGTMVGGGFYALVGKVSAEAGTAAPSAFFASALVALVTAMTFAELAARFPYSGGPSRYVLEVFGRRWLASLVGWLVIGTGVVSAATLAVAFAGFLADLAPVPPTLAMAVMIVVLAGVAAWGIGESVGVALVITVLEVGGLLYIIGANADALAVAPQRMPELLPSGDPHGGFGVALGAFLAFYAFVGFEDLVTMAEEVEEPSRTIPRAIGISLALTTLLYVLVSTVSVLVLDSDTLVDARSPLARLVGGSAAPVVVGIIGMLAGVNGALVQLVMGARVLYGMADEGAAPSVLGRVHPKTQTPILATAVVAAITGVLALGFPLVALARVTSYILLAVFALMNVTLVVHHARHPKAREPDGSGGGLRLPTAVPVLGFVLCVGLIAVQAVWSVGGH